MAQPQLQAGPGLVAHSGGVGPILCGVLLTVVNDTIYIPVPSPGTVNAKGVAFPGALLLISGIDHLIIGSGSSVFRNTQGHSLSLNGHTRDLDPPKVRGQSPPILQDVGLRCHTAHIHSWTVGDLHRNQSLTIKGHIRISLNTADVCHSQAGTAGQRDRPADSVPSHLDPEKPGQIYQGDITHATGQVGSGIHSHAAGLLLPIPEGQAGLPLYKGDLPLLLLVGQPQLGADGHRHLGPAVPVHIGRSGQLQGPSVQSDGHRALCLDRQAQRQHHGQRQRQR